MSILKANLTPEQQSQLRKKDEQFRDEFRKAPLYAARGITEESYLEMRRVDEGFAVLTPGGVASKAPAETSWLASELGEPSFV